MRTTDVDSSQKILLWLGELHTLCHLRTLWTQDTAYLSHFGIGAETVLLFVWPGLSCCLLFFLQVLIVSECLI